MIVVVLGLGSGGRAVVGCVRGMKWVRGYYGHVGCGPRMSVVDTPRALRRVSGARELWMTTGSRERVRCGVRGPSVPVLRRVGGRREGRVGCAVVEVLGLGPGLRAVVGWG